MDDYDFHLLLLLSTNLLLTTYLIPTTLTLTLTPTLTLTLTLTLTSEEWEKDDYDFYQLLGDYYPPPLPPFPPGAAP